MNAERGRKVAVCLLRVGAKAHLSVGFRFGHAAFSFYRTSFFQDFDLTKIPKIIKCEAMTTGA